MSKNVCVIGAGAAGLQLAHLLLQNDFAVTIVEASNMYGGRIRERKAFADFDIEDGAEEVHGENSLHYEMAIRAGAELIHEENLHNYIEINGKLLGPKDLKSMPGYTQLLEINRRVSDYDGKEISMEEFLSQLLVPEEFVIAYKDLYGAEWNLDLKDMGVKALKRSMSLWRFGQKNFLVKNMSNIEILRRNFGPEVFETIEYNTQVKNIEYSENDFENVKITDQDGRISYYDLVVVTIPISQLQKGVITFNPPLPQAKQKALQEVLMGPAMKVALKFNTQFWPDDMGYMISQKIEKSTWPSSTSGKSKKDFVLMSMINGETATEYTQKAPEEVERLLLDDLVRIFGEHIRSYYEGYVIQDWTKEKFIEGGYSGPFMKEQPGTRKALAEPIGKKVYFAGEGTSDQYGPISGALDSARVAYEYIMRDINIPEQKNEEELQQEKSQKPQNYINV